MSDNEQPLIPTSAPHPRRHPLRGYPAPRSGEKGVGRQSRESPFLSAPRRVPSDAMCTFRGQVRGTVYHER
jgi:hypothetical protein